MASLKQGLEFEDILSEVGDYGKYQKRLMLFFLFPSVALLPWFSMNNLFLIFVPDHWCYVPEVAASNLSLELQRSIVSPNDSTCMRYDMNYTDVIASGDFGSRNGSPLVACDRWLYDTTFYEETAASKWNMVCDRGHLPSLVLTMANVGSIIGTPIYGTLSDKVGRKPVFFVVILITALTAISSILMEDFTAFLVLRTINGSLMPSVFQLPYIILLELVGPSYRTRLNGIANSSWTVGLCALPLIAYLTRHWVTLGLVTSSVTVLMFFYWTFLPESPRWLLSQGRYAEATAALMRIADTNGKSVDPVELRLNLQKLGERIRKEKHLNTVNNTSLDLIRHPNIRKKFLIITLCWVADISAYYGLQINVSNLAGNPFTNFFLLALAEIPGFLSSWMFMELIGRRWCSVTSLVVTGVACLVPVFAPEDLHYVAVAASLVGKLGASAAFMAVYQQSSELYPTTIRAIGMGVSGTFAGMANIIVPYIVFLAIFGKYIPFLIIGLVCLTAGLASSFLPETLNEILPQTVHDAETFGKDQAYLSCTKRSPHPCQPEETPKLLCDNLKDVD